MSNNKQSSVDFIYNELFVVKRWMDLTPGDIDYIFKQAKVMHKGEVVKAWSNGYDEDDRATSSPLKYYNETFGGNNDNP